MVITAYLTSDIKAILAPPAQLQYLRGRHGRKGHSPFYNSKRIAPYIRETCWHSSQKITSERDGGILFEVEVSEPKEVGWWVLQWGAEAEVLEPKSLRRELQETAERLLTLYGKIKYGGDNKQGCPSGYPGANDEPQKRHRKSPNARARRSYQEALSIGLGTAE